MELSTRQSVGNTGGRHNPIVGHVYGKLELCSCHLKWGLCVAGAVTPRIYSQRAKAPPYGAHIEFCQSYDNSGTVVYSVSSEV